MENFLKTTNTGGDNYDDFERGNLTNPEILRLEDLGILVSASSSSYFVGWHLEMPGETYLNCLVTVLGLGELKGENLELLEGGSDDYRIEEVTRTSGLRLCFQIEKDTEIDSGGGKEGNSYKFKMN